MNCYIYFFGIRTSCRCRSGPVWKYSHPASNELLERKKRVFPCGWHVVRCQVLWAKAPSTELRLPSIDSDFTQRLLLTLEKIRVRWILNKCTELISLAQLICIQPCPVYSCCCCSHQDNNTSKVNIPRLRKEERRGGMREVCKETSDGGVGGGDKASEKAGRRQTPLWCSISV